jgi:hypothetical protein
MDITSKMSKFSFFSAGGSGSSAKPSGGRKKYPAPTCGHAVCKCLDNKDAGHGVILRICFYYKSRDGSTKPVFIMGFEKGREYWNFFCEKMEDADKWCWIAIIERASREEAKVLLSRPLQESDITLDKFIGRTPVFLLQLDRTMVTHNLSRRILNDHIVADKANKGLPKCYKEIKAIGFFEIVGKHLVPLPDNPPGYPDTFSDVVKST